MSCACVSCVCVCLCVCACLYVGAVFVGTSSGQRLKDLQIPNPQTFPQDLRRRVNYYVKHLIQDHEGLFNAKQISVIIKTGAA